MTQCKLCGAIDTQQFIKTSVEEFELCSRCSGEDCFKEIDEKEYYQEREADRRFSEWKDKSNE